MHCIFLTMNRYGRLYCLLQFLESCIRIYHEAYIFHHKDYHWPDHTWITICVPELGDICHGLPFCSVSCCIPLYPRSKKGGCIPWHVKNITSQLCRWFLYCGIMLFRCMNSAAMWVNVSERTSSVKCMRWHLGSLTPISEKFGAWNRWLMLPVAVFWKLLVKCLYNLW